MSLCVGSRSCPGERQKVGGALPMTNSLSPHCASQVIHCILMHPKCMREREKISHILVRNSNNYEGL